MSDSVLLYVGESRDVGVDFVLQPEIVAMQTITSASVSVTPSGLSIGSASISGTVVETIVAPVSGNAGTSYDVQFTATTNRGRIMIGCVNVVIEVC